MEKWNAFFGHRFLSKIFIQVACIHDQSSSNYFLDQDLDQFLASWTQGFTANLIVIYLSAGERTYLLFNGYYRIYVYLNLDRRQIINIASSPEIEKLFDRTMEDQMIAKHEEEYVVIDNPDISNTSTGVTADIRSESSKTTRRRKFTETEDDLKLQRMRQIMDQEQQLAVMKLHHEKEMAAVKIAHLKEINRLQLREFAAKAELAELLLKIKEKQTNYCVF